MLKVRPSHSKIANNDINPLEGLSESESVIGLSCQNNSRFKGLRYLCSTDTSIFELSLLSKTVSKKFLEFLVTKGIIPDIYFIQ